MRLIVQLKEEQRESWGEAAPLPGWSQESIEEVARQAILCAPPFAPSLSFGFLSALGQLRDPLPKIPPIPLSYLLQGTAEEISLQAEQALAKGCTSAKMKIGTLDRKEALYLVHQFKDYLRLRLDVNRAWELEEALDFFSPFAKEAFDYIEEPLRDPSKLCFFSHPFALDESLREGFYIEHPLLKALIIKPTLHSDWLKWLRSGKEIILSSAYESDLGLAHLALLACRLKLTHRPLGLGTIAYVREGLLREPIELLKGHLYLPEKLQVKQECLHALPLPH